MIEDLRENLEGPLALPKDAVNWLVTVFEMAQMLDDAYDDGSLEPKDVNKLVWNTFVAMPTNPFYMEKAAVLTPVLITTIMKWHAANAVEEKQEPSESSFIWRAGYYDLVLFVVLLCHGEEVARNNAHLVMKLYGEKYSDYIQEIKHA